MKFYLCILAFAIFAAFVNPSQAQGTGGIGGMAGMDAGFNFGVSGGAGAGADAGAGAGGPPGPPGHQHPVRSNVNNNNGANLS